MTEGGTTMVATDDGERRLAGGMGVASAVLLLVSGLIMAGAPLPDASAPELLAWYHDNRFLVHTAGALNGLAAIPFLVFAAHLRHRLTLDRSGFLSTILFAGAVALVTASTISSLPAAALTLLAGRSEPTPSPSIVHLLADMNFFQHGNMGLLSVPLMGALALLALWGYIGARWVGWLAAVATVLALMAGPASFFPSAAGKPNPLGLLGLAGFVISQVSIIAIGGMMVAGRGSTADAVVLGDKSGRAQHKAMA